ncbi:MAG: hypothetical protein JSS35_08675, partial [Proteobacteria bacterium]|nr:hypothetical protein [Pseudomonadota bacterium]
LAALWWFSVRGLPRRIQGVLLILALGFDYYRFPVSNMAEGPFVGALAAVALVTRAWWRSRPRLHALACGALCAVLVLIKPHGVAAVAGLGALALADAALARDWRTPLIRAGLFAAAFFGVGNLIQWAAEEPVTRWPGFFVSGFYEDAVGVRAPAGAAALGVQAFAISACAALLLAGAPAVVGLAELDRRQRAHRRAFHLLDRDLVFATLLLTLGATLAMVGVFETKVAAAPGEICRLWGRYFEFYAPMLWLAAAPALAQPVGRKVALAAGAVTLAGLVGLLAFLSSGWIVLPWDSAVLTAFFHPDPARAPLGLTVPLRALAAAAGLLAAAAFALRAPPAVVGCALILALSGLSTWLDQAWLGGLARNRAALAHDIAAIAPAVPREADRVMLVTPDINVGHLGFLGLKAQPYVLIADPQAPPAGALDGADAVVAAGDLAPAGAWRAVYRGSQLSLWRPAASSLR